MVHLLAATWFTIVSVAAAHSPSYLYKFDAANAAGVDGSIHVKYTGEDSSTATITAALDFSRVDQAKVAAFDGNCTETVTSYKWHIHTKWSSNPLVCEKGDLSGKFGAFNLDQDSTVSAEWTDEHYPLPAENTATWSIVLHAVCGKETPRIACAVGQVEHKYEHSLLPRRSHALCSALPRVFSTSTNALDVVYRKLLELGESDAFHVTEAQSTAVNMATLGYSIFLHLPTGAGKSLAFQAPALLTSADKTTLVVSPLIALMHDQVAALKRKGVNAIQVSGNERNRSVPLTQLLAGQRLVYTTPEFLQMNMEMRNWLRAAGREERLARIVLDEAHCVLEWGNTFRPSYLQLSQWKTQYFNDVPITLATASVSDEDIARLAELFHVELLRAVPEDKEGRNTVATRHRHMALVQQVTDRKNLRMEVVRKTSEAAQWIANKVGKATTIVYCMTRKEAEDTCLALVRVGCHAGVYHGGLPRKRREFVRKQWMMGQLTIICATSAFGMGIDRSDVRFVVHHSIPLSLSAYSQQIGRSGRDGKPAVCVLLYSEADKGRADTLTTERLDFDSTGSGVISNGSSRGELEEVAAFCEMTTGCRKELLYSHFGFRFESSRCVRNCNCGEELEVAAEHCHDNENHNEENSIRNMGDEEDGVSKGTIEYQYQRILAESKRLKLPKREALSRRLIRDILEAAPTSEEEMASMRGIGQAKAARYFRLFRFD
ncbi:ATP-dependent DNA helicase [Phytophthora palmivora]|uniref:DNA 3'-5' helicase n=1 Tax=Phytophthora palmivora TaxID=4796 RepID=A0A2P4XUL6_9STRA|nr:ATP-dependent DNA helicase [Phytophthora palmivora]